MDRSVIRYAALAAFCLATALLVPLELYAPGGIAWVVSLLLVLRVGDGAFRRRMGVLLAVTALLAVAPIDTDTSTRHIALLAPFFVAVILLPTVVLRRTDPGVIQFRFLPTKFRRADLVYTIISIPLAWGIIKLYWYFSPHMPYQWYLPPEPAAEEVWRLFIGINSVGIWDELFFVNVVFRVLRSLFPFAVANAAQAVVYTAVLCDMAFTGIGPIVVYGFAWTQGAMFEKADNLLYVLLVHIIVDVFLFAAIVGHHYPGYSFGLLH